MYKYLFVKIIKTFEFKNRLPFFKIKAVAIHVQTDIWDAIGDVLFKENQMYKRGKGSFFLHLNWYGQY